MLKRSEVEHAKNEADKAVGRAQVLVAHARERCDPAKNAELQHSLQAAMEDLDRALELLKPVRSTVRLLAGELLTLKVEEEKHDVPA